MFPLLAARFFNEGEASPVGESEADFEAQETARRFPVAPKPGGTLQTLDLQSLPRDVDGPPTELRARREKLALFEKDCTNVGGALFVSGEYVARDWEILSKAGISHVVNCVGFLYPPYFEKELSYLTLYLQDAPGEDILCVLYDVFDFIQEASETTNHGVKNKVLIHCSQGVSRSTSFAIAYRMWSEGRTFDVVSQEVKAMRGISNPNIGFICQLLQWHKRRTEDALVPRLFRIAAQSPSAPQYLVPKLSTKSSLDPRGAFVLHAAPVVYIWKGENCPDEYVDAAQRFAKQLCRYENARGPPVLVQQGEELTENFLLAFAKAAGMDASNDPGYAHSVHMATEVSAYDKDYEIYAKASQVRPIISDAGNGDDSARSARKTPRMELPYSVSPNDRLRKQQRSARSNRTSGSSDLNSESDGDGGVGIAGVEARELPVTDSPSLPSHNLLKMDKAVPRLELGNMLESNTINSESGFDSREDSFLESDSSGRSLDNSEEDSDTDSDADTSTGRGRGTNTDTMEGDLSDGRPGTSDAARGKGNKPAFVPSLNLKSVGS